MPINPKSKIQNPKSKPWLLLAFISVTLIAAFFRFYRLADHPLGLFFDPAINGLDAIRLMQRGGPVIFFPTNGGREALLIYLLVPFLWLFGPNPFSFRLQLAIISLLNVAFLFGFLSDRRLGIRDWTRSVGISNNSTLTSPFTIHNSPFTIWLATLASLTLAVSYWHISISRLDQRPLTVPLLSVLVFWFFLKGWTSSQRRWFVLSGLALGLGFHTYSAARLLPLILILAWLPELFLPETQQSEASSSRAVGPLPIGGLRLWDATRLTACVSRLASHASRFTPLIFTALLVAAPMLWYFVTHSAQFTARAASVMVWNYLSTPADILAELGRNTLRVLGFFCCAGNPNAIFGLPGYPGLSPVLTPFLFIGFIIALKNWRNLFFRLVALWWLSGIFPSIIAIEAPHPLRMIVAVAPTAILVAFGLIYATTWLQARFRLQVAGSKVAEKTHLSHPISHIRITPHALRITFYVLPLILVFATIPNTLSAYFIQWPRLQVTQGIYDYGAIAIRDTVLAQANNATPLYLPLARLNDAPLLYYLSGTYRRQAALSASSTERVVVISPEKNEQDAVWVRLHGGTVTILPPLTPAGQEVIQAALSGENATPIRTMSGEIVAHMASLPTDPVRFVQSITDPLTATFGPARLMGATYPTTIDPGSGQLPVTLFWQATTQMVDEYEVLLQLVDDNRRVWGDGTTRPNDWVYPTTFWRPGLDTVAAQQIITHESDALPAGRYWLAVSLYHPALGQRRPLTEGASHSPNTFFIGPLKVPLPPPTPPLQGGVEEKGTFGDVAQLLSFKIDDAEITAGEPVQINLLWEALGPASVDYTVFIHLLDPNDNRVAGNDTQPVNNTYPTTLWNRGEQIPDPHTLPTPNNLPPGQYRLAIGLYHQSTGERLPLHYPDGHQDDQGRLILDPPITVTNVE